uniref:Uncharacterized protein n=1 Tax=Picea glauca TaxID=3330 RepID=A0A101LW48_PICGL|nr:hypothetical protein ABT39_MTgene1555 [Picea glauca]
MEWLNDRITLDHLLHAITSLSFNKSMAYYISLESSRKLCNDRVNKMSSITL